jgi:hypothetical protein
VRLALDDDALEVLEAAEADQLELGAVHVVACYWMNIQALVGRGVRSPRLGKRTG